MAPPLDPNLRNRLLVGGLVFVLLGYLVYSQLIEPKSGEIAEMETRLENVRLQNTTARNLTRGAGADDVKARLAAYNGQLRAVEALIPSAEDIPDLLDAISVQAQQSGVQISLIQPTGATEEGYYTRRSYDMAVVGEYHEIADFLTRVGSLPRIVTPVNLVLTPAGAATAPAAAQDPDGPRLLEARFSIETYVIPTGEPDAASAD
jgi:type IV pilus assembly protein PilO